MSFVKRGDAEKILHIVESTDIEEEKVKLALDEAKNIKINGNKEILPIDPKEIN